MASDKLSRFSSTSCKTTTVTKILVMLRIPKRFVSLIGVCVERSEKPAVEDQRVRLLVQIAAERPGTPTAILESKTFCNRAVTSAREKAGEAVWLYVYHDVER
jgi:hypothetical protein